MVVTRNKILLIFIKVMVAFCFNFLNFIAIHIQSFLFLTILFDAKWKNKTKDTRIGNSV